MSATNSAEAASGAPAGARTVGKTRGPVAVWLLTLVTFGIYYLVWYYKINRELRDFDPSIKSSPGVSLLAITLGGVLIVPPFVSLANTAGRIRRAQSLAGQAESCSGLVGILLCFVFGTTPIYYQGALNQVWKGSAPRG
ncbi:DUF4234 domain-containing protein [Streptomyces sp. HB2AG]|uniref:DUF4234 domain-containing protein n=1 Tax=Streptomyces sp. HB2AG TaxID=2983400 RepID=UPI0022AA6090|nr:DUF4234 domain-containing protein [Streptomyces sp. HB2AG]MCZ2527937.1 DUF4234 domain-containing protein [Streptomyces sp. HB2AG]